MQTNSLPIQVTGATPNPGPNRANVNANADTSQFSQALSREMDQRQNSPAPPPASPAKPAAAAKAQETQSPKTPAPPAPAKPADAAKASASSGASAGKAATEEAEEDATALAAPVADLLALVASLNLPPQQPAPDPLTGKVPPPTAAPVEMPVDLALPAVVGSEPAIEPLAVAGPALEMDAEATADSGAFQAMLAKAGEAAPHDKPGASAADAMKAPAAGEQKPELKSSVQAPNVSTADIQAQAKPQADPAQAASLRAREGAIEQVVVKEAAAVAPASAPVQQASLNIAQAAAGVAGDKIPARVGTPAWDNQIGQKIVWMVAGKEQSASLTLNPPDLGPMQVVLNVTNDQATVTFSAPHLEVRQALEDAMPRLREMMSEGGIALGNATVNDGAREQRQAQGEAARGGGGRFGANGGGDAAPPAPRTAAPRGLVDTFA